LQITQYINLFYIEISMKNLVILLICCFCIILTVGCVSQITRENSTKYTVNQTSITLTPTINYDAREALQSANEISLLMDKIQNIIIQNDVPVNSHMNEFVLENQKNQLNFPVLLRNFQTDLDTIDSTQPLLNDLNIKITQFSGDTVRWHGDTRTYAEQASTQMRAIYNDISDATSNERGLISYVKLCVASAQEGKSNINCQLDEYTTKMNNNRIQANKDRDSLRDTLKKIEELQN
jgi:hypothetical protein